jgi:hypothetical protein
MDSTYISNEILKTKYKDVSFDQVSGCFVPADEEDCFNWEYMFRGKEVTIFLPPIPNNLIENGFIYENEFFVGWGPEDKERYFRFNILGYKIYRVNGDIFHLKHPASSWTNPYLEHNNIWWNKIQRTLNTPEKMRKYMNEKFEWMKQNDNL